MTYGDGGYGGSSFEQGKANYKSAMEYIGQGRKGDARKYLELAINIFKMCSQQSSEAAKYLGMAEQELQNLGR